MWQQICGFCPNNSKVTSPTEQNSVLTAANVRFPPSSTHAASASPEIVRPQRTAESSGLADLGHSGANGRCECLPTRMDELCGFSYCLEKVYKKFEVGSPEITCSNRSGTIGAKGRGLTERMQIWSISRPGRYPTGPPLETLVGLRAGPVRRS